MARSDQSDRRVLIMDDVSWSEAPRRRRGAEQEDLAPASWVAQDDWRMDRGMPEADSLADDEWATSTHRSNSAGRTAAPGPTSSAGRPAGSNRPSIAGRALLDETDAPDQAGGVQVVAEFDWTSADAHTIEDHIWGTARAELATPGTGAGPADPLMGRDSPPAQSRGGRAHGRAAAAADDEDLWGPRPRLIADEPGGRRTVVITGRVADRYAAPRQGRDDSLPAHHRWAHMGSADRMAMWAVALGVILVLVAILSAH